jgi:hypothetical protein
VDLPLMTMKQRRLIAEFIPRILIFAEKQSRRGQLSPTTMPDRAFDFIQFLPQNLKKIN